MILMFCLISLRDNQLNIDNYSKVSFNSWQTGPNMITISQHIYIGNILGNECKSLYGL